jgi:hypothetical protein
VSRITTFTPGSAQEVTVTYTNTTGAPLKGVRLGLSAPEGWKTIVQGSGESEKRFHDRIMPGASVKAAFSVTSPSTTGGGYITGRAEWKNKSKGQLHSEATPQRVRNVLPVKINEVRLESGDNPENQFIELYNAGDEYVDISDWSLINTRSMWAPVKLVTIPAGTKIAPRGFYLLGLSGSGLAAPAREGENSINVLNTKGFGTGQTINIEGELNTIVDVGTAASPMAVIFVPVSTGPWLTIPAGSTNMPVTDAEGFEAGQKIGIDIGGSYEEATVTAVGKAATLTNLASEAKAGETIIKVMANSNMTVNDTLTVGTGGRKELVEIKRIIKTVAAPARGMFGPARSGNGPGEVELSTPLRFDHMPDEDVSDKGTGITFSPATRFAHKSGDAVQAFGSGIRLGKALERSHEAGAAVVNPLSTSVGYQGAAKPDQWYGVRLSAAAGSIVLMNASGDAVVDAIVYGSQQSNSSANGTVTSPEIATLEGDQSQGGCMTVVPGSFSGFGQFIPAGGKSDKSVGRFPDGTDTDSNCSDFMLQKTITLATSSAAGATNIKVTSVAGFSTGQKIIIGTGRNSETTFIADIGTSGGSMVNSAIEAGTTVIPVASSEGFSAGQTITIDDGAKRETAVVASVTAVRRRFGSPGTIPADTIRVTGSLDYPHPAGAQVSGSGITLTSTLTLEHEAGAQVADNLPTPGAPNQYSKKLK